MAKVVLNVIIHCLVALMLAILTQVGAVTYAVSLLLYFAFRQIRWLGFLLANISLYALCTFLIVPQTAPMFGRVPLAFNDHLKPANAWLSIGHNRNFVVPELNRLLGDLSRDMAELDSNVVVTVLDANFPFINHYPLLPHLSHDDGRKVDLANLYEDEKGVLVAGTPSRSGYGVFEHPAPDETNTNERCKDQGYFQYDYPKYLTLDVSNETYNFSTEWNKTLLEILLSYATVEKVFVEPHLVNRLQLDNNRVRFHGCGAVRHDDHIHVQI
ncbi:hypothetical protein [Reinekea blandensis]|uniref:Transmembrane protein n=1 Tax=Reinekea blandensis MED297 TaxID=314283 RepID=A4BJM6_9GAMM|nr:hypothetical protein [Reinekea blandensis]EAR07666.1 hypothetical protein MED297_06489 [Reinekea sp. MED297] [Reinekea blandensis MED297]